MRAVTRVALAALCSGLSAAPASLWGQGQWVPPQPPCDLPAGHFKVTGGVLYLKNAAEKPNQRDQQLAQARKVLTEAIAQDHQEKNPAAWYYLGRYYFEVSDARGTDTAFARALALQPKCADDIRGYRSQVWAKTVNGGLAAWQEGKEDSAVVLFHLAARLEPTNPKPFSALAGLYATKDNDDSALVYYRQAAAIPGDSTVLAKLVASSQSRKARRTTLAPADQRLFARDSTGRAQAVKRARSARAAIGQQLAADSAALARSEEHTSELQSLAYLVCRLLLEKKKTK